MLVYLNRQFLFPLFILWSAGALGQTAIKSDPAGPGRTKSAVIEVLSPKGVNVSQPGRIIFKHSGNVKLRHQGILLFCDQALYQVTDNRIDAIGHVLIVQGDTIIVKADTLVYDGTTRQAFLRGRVTFQDRRIILNTVQLDYNLNTGIAHYTGKGRLVDSRNVLTSREGYYDTQSRQIELQHMVRLISPENTLTAEALIYNTISRQAVLVEATRITGKDGVSVARRGQYNTQENILQQSAADPTLKLARTNDSLPQSPATVSKAGIAMLLTAASKPVDTAPLSNTAADGQPATSLPSSKIVISAASSQAITASGSTKQHPGEPFSQRDTGYAVDATGDTKVTKDVKVLAKKPVVATRQPIKGEEPVGSATTLVLTEKPDEQLLLAIPKSGPNTSQAAAQKQAESITLTETTTESVEPKPLDMPVHLTGVTFLKAMGPTARQQVLPSLTRQITPPPALPIERVISTVTLAADLPKPIVEIQTDTAGKKVLTVGHPSVHPALSTANVSSGPVAQKAATPVLATVAGMAKSGLPLSVQPGTNSSSGSSGTFQATIVVVPKRIARPAGSQAAPDPGESDLERTLNRKKRYN